MNRRQFLATTIVGTTITPPFRQVTGSNMSRLDIPDPTLSALNTEGVNLFGISPDASVLVGRRDRESIVFLDAETRLPISESVPLPEISILDERTIAWSPDGTRLTFGINAWQLLRDSDIFVADVATGEVTNLTPEGHDEEVGSLLDVQDVKVDTSPVWLDDDTVLFARNTNPTGDGFMSELWTLSLNEGTQKRYMDMTDHNIRDIYGKIWLLSGGELVFMATITGENFQNGMVMISADGEVTIPHREKTRTSQLLSVNDSHAIVLDMQAYEWWYLSLDDSLDPVLLWEQFELPEGWMNKAFPVLGPEPDTMFTVLQTPHDRYSAHLFTPDGNRQLAELAGDFGNQDFHWAEDCILIAGKADSWLVPLEGVHG